MRPAWLQREAWTVEQIATVERLFDMGYSPAEAMYRAGVGPMPKEQTGSWFNADNDWQARMVRA